MCLGSSLLAAQDIDVKNSVGNLFDLKYAHDNAHILSFYPLSESLSVANVFNVKENVIHLILLDGDGLHLDSLFLNNSRIKDFYPINNATFLISGDAGLYTIDYNDTNLQIRNKRESKKGVVGFAKDSIVVEYTAKSGLKNRKLTIDIRFANQQKELAYKFKNRNTDFEYPSALQWPGRKFMVDDMLYFPTQYDNSVLAIDFEKETISEIKMPEILSGKGYYILYDYPAGNWYVIELIDKYKNNLYQFDMDTKDLYLLQKIEYYPTWIENGKIYFRDFVNHRYAISTRAIGKHNFGQ